MRLSEALELWLLSLQAEGRRPSTLKSYREHLRPLLRSLEGEGVREAHQVTPFHLRRYLAAYRSGHSPHGARSVFASLRAFLRFLEREGVLERSPLSGLRPPRTPTPARQGYSPGEMRALLALLQGDRTPLGLRNLAAVSLLLDCGLRAGELCRLRLADLALDGALLVRESKTGRPRTVYLGRRSQQALARYLSLGRPRLSPRGDWLLLAEDGGPMSTGALRQLLRRLGEKVGVKLSAHRLRHTWATQMLRAGADLETLRLLGGWSGYEMVRQYAHLAQEDLRERAGRWSPLDRLG